MSTFEFFEPRWVVAPAYRPRRTVLHPIKDFPAVPLGDLADRITVWWDTEKGMMTLCVESRGQTHEVGRYDGNRWLWCRAKEQKFLPWEELMWGVVQSDEDALSLCVHRHSGEFCHNQAVENFWNTRSFFYWEDVLRKIQPLFPVAFVLFE